MGYNSRLPEFFRKPYYNRLHVIATSFDLLTRPELCLITGNAFPVTAGTGGAWQNAERDGCGQGHAWTAIRRPHVTAGPVYTAGPQGLPIFNTEKHLTFNSLNSTIYNTKDRVIYMAQIITANDLKTKGVSLLKEETEDGTEVIITVRGKSKYVVLPIEKYNYLRECELDAAIQESRKDLNEGKFKKETVEKHIKRITRG
jgi:prevent-host-death family protein